MPGLAVAFFVRGDPCGRGAGGEIGRAVYLGVGGGGPLGLVDSVLGSHRADGQW